MVGTAAQNIDLSVVVTGDRAGLATLARNSMGAFAIDRALWRAGTWGAQTDTGFTSARTGLPVPTSHGAALAFAPGPTPAVLVATFDAVTGMWSTDPTTIQSTSSRPVTAGPALAATSSGDLLVAYAGVVLASPSTTIYGFASRAGTTWTADAPIPGATGPSPLGAITLGRTGDDRIVAVWSSSVTALSAATYRAGVWSAVTPVASDLISGSFRPINLVSLPDGRVALAYPSHATGSPTVGVSVAFFDGAWSTPRTVPGATLSSSGWIPIGLARGANGAAALELVYLEQTTNVARHVRLTTESTWTWASPMTIDTVQADCVALAVGP